MGFTTRTWPHWSESDKNDLQSDPVQRRLRDTIRWRDISTIDFHGTDRASGAADSHKLGIAGLLEQRVAGLVQSERAEGVDIERAGYLSEVDRLQGHDRRAYSRVSYEDINVADALGTDFFHGFLCVRRRGTLNLNKK